MGRVLKQPEVRTQEILDAAEELFKQKGYNETSTSDILEKAKIARGTLYYYFKSKEEILDSVITRSIDRNVSELKLRFQDSTLNALQKLKNIFESFNHNSCENTKVIEYLHKKENMVMHQKTIVQSIKSLSPFIAEIIQQGINEGVFTSDYPQEISEFILVIFRFMFDRSIFQWDNEAYLIRMKALGDLLESSLRTKEGNFRFMSEVSEQIYNI